MPNLNVSKDHIPLILQAIKGEIVSAQRAQKSAKAPQIYEVYKQHEIVLQDLYLAFGKLIGKE